MKTAKEVFNELNSSRLIKWEGLSDGGKWTRAIHAMEIHASQFFTEEQVREAAKSTPIGENILNDLLKALKEQSKPQSE